MPEPVTIGLIALFKWASAHLAVHGAAAAAGTHTLAAAGTTHTLAAAGTTHTLAAAGTTHTLATAAVGFHLTPAAVLGTTIAASTVGGITFLNIYNNLLDDVYSQAKRGLRGMPSAAERRQIADAAYRAAKAELERKHIMTPESQAEMSRVYLALAA
jgi:hypothetical protein